MSFSVRSKVDLDELVQDIHNWQKHMEDICQTNHHVNLDIKATRKQCEISETKEENTAKDASQMRILVDKLQGMLGRRCDIEDDNRTLKELVVHMQSDLTRLTKEHTDKEDEEKKQREDLIDKHREELVTVSEAATIETKKQVATLEKGLEEKESDIKALKKQISDAEKVKHMEIVKLKFEYDAKISRLQKQMTKVQQLGSKGSSLNSDIFRQKLLYAKEEASNEVAALKRTITELEKKLTNQQTSKRRKF